MSTEDKKEAFQAGYRFACFDAYQKRTADRDRDRAWREFVERSQRPWERDHDYFTDKEREQKESKTV